MGDYQKVVALQKRRIEDLKAIKTKLSYYKKEIDSFSSNVCESEKKWLSKIEKEINEIKEIQKL